MKEENNETQDEPSKEVQGDPELERVATTRFQAIRAEASKFPPRSLDLQEHRRMTESPDYHPTVSQHYFPGRVFLQLGEGLTGNMPSHGCSKELIRCGSTTRTACRPARPMADSWSQAASCRRISGSA